MSAIPRIVRAIPKGTVITPDEPIPVIACLHWLRGSGTLIDEDIHALAIAWTPDAVEIRWAGDEGHTDRTDWIPATHVRRPGEERRPDDVPRRGEVTYISLTESERPPPQHRSLAEPGG